MTSKTTVTPKLDLSKLDKRVYTPHDTPLDPMPILSKALGADVNLFIKRDDMLGLVGGGNKTRKLEYVLADAIAQGADTIVTCGAVQSNHCRLTLSACNKEGLDCCLVLEERVANSYHPNASGNHYLFRLLGAKKIIKVGLGEAPKAVEALAEELKAQGKKVYCVPGGASNEYGATGYVACAQEIQKQSKEQDIDMHTVVCASGSGGTHAGMSLGFSSDPNVNVIGISTRHAHDHQTEHIYQLAQKTYSFLLKKNDMEDAVLPKDAVLVKDEYVGPGYSLPTIGMQEAVTMFARLEGILLDPVYTGKAAAGLIDLVRGGAFPAGSNVVFLHTGGAPSLYHYQPILPSMEEAELPPPSKKEYDGEEKKCD
jgi:D-cysteine desulfhydrase